MSFTGRVVVVTGASSGIGRRVALDLAARGATVCAAARRANQLEALVSELGGRPHSWVRCDVANRDDVAGLASHVRSEYGRCDILINNAGIPQSGRFEDAGGREALERTMAVNFWGAVNCTEELLPLLRESGAPAIVNVSSVAGRLALGGASAYCASKFALTGWTEALQAELRPRGVHVCLIEPGFVPTEGFPQRDLLANPLTRRAVGTVEQVSAAVIDALENRRPERVVPRFYYLAVLARFIIPGPYRAVAARLVDMAARR